MAFFFCLTNVGLEKSLKSEMTTRFPDWRLAYSAPGFITFKGEGAWPTPVFARLWGECLGKEDIPGATILDLGDGGRWSVKVQTPAPLWNDPLQLSHLELPSDSPSRAWLKIEEAIRLFKLDMKSGDTALEVGAAPGGAVMALLNRGLHVRAVDPALMDERLNHYASYRHIKKPFQELSGEEIQGVDWWLSDLNLAPGSVLSHLGRLLREVEKPRGLVITLKIGKPEVTREIAQHEQRVREWGYRRTEVRLLPSHHQEVVLVARRN
ncbi:MAG: SAM-dependent methyltransferase [Bacteriovoracia bacterium]